MSLVLRSITIAALATACFGFFASAALADCSSAPTGRVVLESDAVDPDVFLWDSKIRLADYASGTWGNTRAIFAHTMLAEPGTYAVVIACSTAVARTKDAPSPLDAIGVRITSGPYRGRYGWVLATDIHVPRPSGESAVLGAPRP